MATTHLHHAQPRREVLHLRIGARDKALIRAAAIAADIPISQLVRRGAKAEAQRLLAQTGART